MFLVNGGLLGGFVHRAILFMILFRLVLGTLNTLVSLNTALLVAKGIFVQLLFMHCISYLETYRIVPLSDLDLEKN